MAEALKLSGGNFIRIALPVESPEEGREYFTVYNSLPSQGLCETSCLQQIDKTTQKKPQTPKPKSNMPVKTPAEKPKTGSFSWQYSLTHH